jgi:hypothetical protein
LAELANSLYSEAARMRKKDKAGATKRRYMAKLSRITTALPGA